MQMMANRYRFKLSRMRERWGYYWRLPSILVTALHPPYTQNLCDLLKFILTINVFFYLSYLNTLHPTSKFIIYQTILSFNISLFSKSRCPSMMASIIGIVVYNKPTAEHQYLLRSPCHPFRTKRVFPFTLALRIRRICSSNETYNFGLLNQEIQRVHTTPTLTQATHPHVSL